MIASHNVIRLEGCLFSTTQDRALRRAHVLHLGRWIQNCADRVAALLQHWCVPLEDRPHLQSGVETLASRTCRPPPIGHTAVRTKTAGSYWTSTQQTMNPGGPLGHQNRRHTWHMPLSPCVSHRRQSAARTPSSTLLSFSDPFLCPLIANMKIALATREKFS